MGDYQTSPFAAQTDFKVGTAIKALSALGYEVHVHYITSEDRRRDESAWITRLEASGYSLLNRLPGYKYRTADQSAEEARIVGFVQGLHQAFSEPGTASDA